jgi:spermidine synthase
VPTAIAPDSIAGQDGPVANVLTLARHLGPRGEVVLRRRTGDGPDVEELIVNGAFAMDSSETSTEQRLGEIALTATRDGTPYRVLVGGLGLGYTGAAILRGDVAELEVVELEDCLVEWARRGLTPTLAGLAASPKVRLRVGDVCSVLLGEGDGPAGPWNAVVLDVDNGPDFLIHQGNEALYSEATLGAAYGRLAPGGLLAIWCQGPALELWTLLGRLGSSRREHRYEVARGNRRFEYVIYTLARPSALTAAARQQCGHD